MRTAANNDAVLKTWKREREKESVRCSSSSLKRSRSFSSEEKVCCCFIQNAVFGSIVSMYRNSLSLLLSKYVLYCCYCECVII